MLLRNNNHITTQFSSSSKAMMRLMDQLAGVLVNSVENYNFDASKFDLYDKEGQLYLLPTNDFVTETKDSFSNNINVRLLKVQDGKTIEVSQPIQSQAKSGIGGCMALKYHPGAGLEALGTSIPASVENPSEIPSLMLQFFEMMDTAICELVDARYPVAL